MSTALVLAGAVAKGAFEAGVLSVLAERGERISMLVATSAGSLNAAVYATGVRCGREKRAAEVLQKLWADQADWKHIVDFSFLDALGGRGLSSTVALQGVVERGMNDVAESAEPAFEVSVRLVTTVLRGLTRDSQARAATTFEHAIKLQDHAFDTPQSRRAVATAAVASAAFPGVFVPVEVAGLGPCVDGGTVNNAPISWAIEEGADRVIVVTGNPSAQPPEGKLAWLDLVGKEVDIAINERLFRDLRQARSVNDKLASLAKELERQGLPPEQQAAALGSLGWKPLEIVEIRPAEPLAGNPFSALGQPGLRREYLELGRRAAELALGPS
ncbi:MAG TPA: patatin-like phospholipase family protein [Polyangiaceae bacterium]|nr:patatin-like phospholipase family protein [Polyangiaceae bacterium]